MHHSSSLKLSLLGLTASLALTACDTEDVSSCSSQADCDGSQVCSGSRCQVPEEMNTSTSSTATSLTTSSSATATSATATSTTATATATSANTTSTNNTTTSTSSTSTGTNTATGTATSTGTGTMTTVPERNPCDDTPQPARCAENPDAFTMWGPASVVDSFKVVQGSTCCVDYTGDGVLDNGFGSYLGQFNILQSVNNQIASSIADGSFALVLEHEGLDPMGGMFGINSLVATPVGFTTPSSVGANAYLVSRSNFAAGVFANTRLDSVDFIATAAQGPITGGPGKSVFPFRFLAVSFALPLYETYIKGTITSLATSYTDGTGIAIVDGELGGIIRIADFYEGLNDLFETTCKACVKFKDAQGQDVPFMPPYIRYNPASAQNAQCTAQKSDVSGCPADVKQVCEAITNNCTTLIGVLASGLDVDTAKLGQSCEADAFGNDSTCNAFSIGANFTAVGAKITGVSP